MIKILFDASHETKMLLQELFTFHFLQTAVVTYTLYWGYGALCQIIRLVTNTI